jgi:hypothetical protein
MLRQYQLATGGVRMIDAIETTIHRGFGGIDVFAIKEGEREPGQEAIVRQDQSSVQEHNVFRHK